MTQLEAQIWPSRRKCILTGDSFQVLWFLDNNILSYFQILKVACHSSMDADRRFKKDSWTGDENVCEAWHVTEYWDSCIQWWCPTHSPKEQCWVPQVDAEHTLGVQLAKTPRFANPSVLKKITSNLPTICPEWRHYLHVSDQEIKCCPLPQREITVFSQLIFYKNTMGNPRLKAKTRCKAMWQTHGEPSPNEYLKFSKIW